MLDEIEHPDEHKKLGKELNKVEQAIDEVQKIRSLEEAKKSLALDRVRRFINKLEDTSTKVGKCMKVIEDGVGYAQDIAKFYYNGIA